MGSEYIKLTNSEKIFGTKTMLHMQLEYLNSIRSYRKYKDLRSKEFILKISLKNRIGEALALMAKFHSLLPKTSYRLPDQTEEKRKRKVSSTLQDEIELVKRKLTRLQSG